MLGIYPIELAAELEIGHDCRRVSTHLPTQLNSTQHDIVQVSIFLLNLSAVVVNCEFNTHRVTSTRRRWCVLGLKELKTRSSAVAEGPRDVRVI